MTVETLAAAPSVDVPALPVDATVEGAATRLWVGIISGVLIAVPFLVVHFPPITDLPQHVAQIRLFLLALADPENGYRIQWFTPYSAAYVLLGAAWALATPEHAGRLATLLLATLWVAALHTLAARRRRSATAATLASVLIFNHALYWGFLSFLVGGLGFVLWMLVTMRPATAASVRRDALCQGAAAALLYAGHALWFAFGLGWLVAYALAHRWPARVALWRLGAVLPVAVAAALWYPHLEALGFVSPTVWFTAPMDRLAPEWIVDAVLGGLYGPTEALVAGVLLLWVAAGLWQRRRDLAASLDGDLVWTGVLLTLLALTLPDQHMNTIQFAARWMPFGAMLIVLGVPAPATLGPLQRPLALTVLGVFSLATTLAWMTHEREELSGLADALAFIPAEQRVLGLDLVQESRIIKGRPFLQTAAYAQVLHGGRLHASFAGFAPSLVVYRTRHPAPWTPNLEWFAERVRPQDFAHFDYVLINGRPHIHAQAAAMPIAPVTRAGRWRLYRVSRGAS